jgi:hypothetical protein
MTMNEFLRRLLGKTPSQTLIKSAAAAARGMQTDFGILLISDKQE